MLTLHAQERNPKDSVQFIRKQGNMPAVIYSGGKETTLITIVQKDFLKIYKQAGESTTVSIDLNGKEINTLIHDSEFDPVTGMPAHADFLIVDMKKTVTVSVPLEFTGISPAAKSGLGILVKVMHEIEVSALPADIPHTVIVDISGLDTLESQITAADITLPKNVTLKTKSSEIVASIAEQKEEKEESSVDISKIEVQKKGKKEEAE